MPNQHEESSSQWLPPRQRTSVAVLTLAALALAASAAAVAQTAPADAAYQAALNLQKGEGVEANPTAAAAEFQRLADAGHVEAGCRYAEALIKGTGVAKNFKVANQYAEKAAGAGISACMIIVGDAYQLGRSGYPKNGATALEWYLKAANAGDAQGMYEAGEAYRTGDGVPDDTALAVKWLQKAVDRGHVQAMSSLGFIFVKNKGDFIRRDDGVRLLRQAAQGQSGSARIWLGEILAFGSDGVEPIPAEGQKWLKAAADLPNARACMALARIYRDGIGVDADWAQAVQWADKARKAKDLSATTFMGRLYAQDGPNFKQNKQLAFDYLKSAYGAGQTDALDDLKQLVDYRTAKELLTMADTTFYWMTSTAFFGRKLGSQQEFDYSDTDRLYYIGGARLILHFELQKSGDLLLTMQASNLDDLKTFYKAYVLDQLHKLKGNDAWLSIRTQLLD